MNIPFRISASRISNMTCIPTNKTADTVTRKAIPVDVS
jgi:hypothetical protein